MARRAQGCCSHPGRPSGKVGAGAALSGAWQGAARSEEEEPVGSQEWRANGVDVGVRGSVTGVRPRPSAYPPPPGPVPGSPLAVTVAVAATVAMARAGQDQGSVRPLGWQWPQTRWAGEATRTTDRKIPTAPKRGASPGLAGGQEASRGGPRQPLPSPPRDMLHVSPGVAVTPPSLPHSAPRGGGPPGVPALPTLGPGLDLPV